MSDQKYVLLINGFPGTGKLTVATAFCELTGARLIDNHMLNNPIFSFVREDGKTKMPPEVWESVRAIRKIVLGALATYASPNLDFTFTNCLANEDEEDVRIFEQIKEAAEQSGRVFVPIILTCDLEENQRRMMEIGREAKMKMRDAGGLADMRNEFTLVGSDHPNVMILDITDLQPSETAERIRSHIKKFLV